MHLLRFPRLVFISAIFLIVLLSAAPSISASSVTTHSGTSKNSSSAPSPQAQGDWTQFRYGPQHTGTNPFEKTLKPANVGRLKKVWSEPDYDLSSSPAVANGVVYIGSGDDHLYAFNAQTGSLLWSTRTGSGAIDSSPAVANGVVYFSTDYGLGLVYACNAQTGKQLWSSDRARYGFSSSPAVVNGMVFIASTYERLQAYALLLAD
jgi:outer membrane protein assembly factor BamB